MAEHCITFKVSAPGKVILHGEHSVVYGKMALAASLNLRTTLSFQETTSELVLDFPDINVHQSWTVAEISELAPAFTFTDWQNPDLLQHDHVEKVNSFIQSLNLGLSSPQETALLSFFCLYFAICGAALPAFTIGIISRLPIGAGVGSSASFSVCLAASLVRYRQCKTLDSSRLLPAFSMDVQELISKWAFTSEKIIHGTPSGIDNSICTYGSFISFEKGEITPVPGAVVLEILLVNTCISRNTKALVAKTRERYTRHKNIVEPILESLHEISVKALEIVRTASTDGQKHDFSKLEELIDMNQALLSALGVSHPSLDLICQIAAKYNLHAKLTGAGGGGFAYVLLPPDISPQTVSHMEKELTEKGFQCYKSTLGGQGVMLHSMS